MVEFVSSVLNDAMSHLCAQDYHVSRAKDGIQVSEFLFRQVGRVQTVLIIR